MISRKIIIAVPFYNEELYLDQTLACLKQIPRAKDEIGFFLCDNQSTDRSREIAEKYVASDSRFKLHTHSENIGAIDNLWFALQNSDSDFFMWLGGHDLIDPTYPHAALEAFQSSPEISYAAAMPYGFKKSPRWSRLMKDAYYKKLSKNPLERYFQSVERLGNCTLLNSLFRRSYAEGFLFKPTISWDHVFISHLLWQGPIHYTVGHRYYRRLFENKPNMRESKLIAKKVQPNDLHYSHFFDLYVANFQNRYHGSENHNAYLSYKILEILERRFGFKSFDSPVEGGANRGKQTPHF